MSRPKPQPTLEETVKLKTFICLSLLLVFASLTQAAYAQTFSVIHSFSGTGGDGARPEAGVTLRAGTLYGTTSEGGGGTDSGVVYQITHSGSNWITLPILLFDGTNGGRPRARVVFGPDRHLYGTTFAGGTFSNGVVFNLTPPFSICKTANCLWKENILHDFSYGPTDGAGPGFGDLVWDQQGNIYGTTFSGGAFDQYGTVYQLTLSGSNWTETLIHSFSGSDGETPEGGVIVDSNGNLFGTTNSNTNGFNSGLVFELTYMPGTGWTQTILHKFLGGEQEGEWPVASLLADGAGNLFGTTPEGGNINGGGTVFELSPAGNTWTLTTLYNFPSNGGLNCGPEAPLTMDAAGNLYGTSVGGPQCGYAYGNVFKLTKFGNSFGYSSLYEFTGGSDGGFPKSQVILDTDGTLYGTTYGGGQANLGVVWMIKPSGITGVTSPL